MVTAIKYSPETYDLGLSYEACSAPLQESVNVALNSIDPPSDLGKVLSGQNPYYTFLLVDLKATDSDLEYMSIQLQQVSGRMEPIINVSTDGSYYRGNNHVKILGAEQPVKAAALA